MNSFNWKNSLVLMLCFLFAIPAKAMASNQAFPGNVALQENLALVFAVLVGFIAVLMVIMLNRRTKRIKQELEARLEQEQRQHQADAMITALAADYQSVFYVDVAKDEGICYRYNEDLCLGLRKGDVFPFREKIVQYANTYVAESDRPGFLQFIDLKNICAKLREKPLISYRYLALRDGRAYYEMLRVVEVNLQEEGTGMDVQAVSVGIANVDSETREAMSKSRALSDALSRAEAASSAKTSFLSSMSHQIRTPMNAIIGLNSLALKEPGLSEHAREYLEKIDSSAKHLLSLINDILSLRRIESGRIPIRREKFSLCEMVSQVNDMIKEQCQDKGLRYECRIVEDVSDVYIGDAMKLKQVIINILDNAIKFTHAPGTISFIVKAAAQSGNNAILHFEMKDTGIGMDKEFLPEIFNVFSKENEQKTEEYSSPGLGMAISKMIVEKMNGKIEVESEKGVGSTFTVTVPLKILREGAEDTATETDYTTRETRRADLAGRIILLAEDMSVNAEVTKELLRTRDIEVEYAENGQVAVDLFANSELGTYAAILMDLRMPVMDGISATKAIRAMERPDANTIPIIAMTAQAFEEDVQHSLQAGMTAHLSKPVEPDKLFEVLERLIET